jgi:hypothetical protein
VLIARGKGYLIHALPSWSPEGLVVLHTSTTTGRMKRLARGGTSSYQGPPMGIDRIYHTFVRIAGIAADSQRLCVLRWQGRSETLLLGRPHRPALPTSGTYHLLVFRAADGKKLHEVPVDAVPPGRTVPVETFRNGPLRLSAAGVTCFGTLFELDGERLIRPRPATK